VHIIYFKTAIVPSTFKDTKYEGIDFCCCFVKPAKRGHVASIRKQKP